MIWYAWRTQRLQLALALAAVLGFTLWLVVVGLHEHARWQYFTQLGCVGAHPPEPTGCAGFRAYNFTHWNPYFEILLYAAPGLLGVLVGAPVVAREIEGGTTRLAWTQGVTRARWLAAKLVVPGAVVVLLGVVLLLLGDWWTTAATRVSFDVYPTFFDVTGVVVVGYVAFAFVLGVTLGALVRRTSVAVIGGLASYAAIRWAVRTWVRVHLAPMAVVASPFPGGAKWNGWPLHEGFVPIGRIAPLPGQTWETGNYAVQGCQQVTHLRLSLDQCAARRGLHWVVQFQPSSHFWALQLSEAGIFVGFSLVLLVVTVWGVVGRN